MIKQQAIFKQIRRLYEGIEKLTKQRDKAARERDAALALIGGHLAVNCELGKSNALMRTALEKCELAMDTAALHDLPQQLPPAYRDSWAAAHINARKVLRPGEQPEAGEEREVKDE